ncbi:MAG: 5'-3' exonuclease [Actinomycetia bacterium]|nr:5'-3' exonuclease [Actinomycetes bacterium]
MTKRLMLLDSASMYFRTFYGVPDRYHGVDGTPVNAVRGFLDAMARLLNTYQPDLLVACWDDDWRPQFRVDLVPTYKAHRVDEQATPSPEAQPHQTQAGEVEEIPDPLAVQVPIMADVLAAIGIMRVGAPGFEADDVIAQYARNHAGPVDIVTGDRDLFQLVQAQGPNRVLYTAKGFGNIAEVDDAWLAAKYGVTGAQYADYSLLRGDSSDGLPGVVGVGEKTASALINNFGSLKEIQEAATNPDSGMSANLRGKVTRSSDYLARAVDVVTLHQEVPVPMPITALPHDPQHPAELVQLSDQYNLEDPANRLLTALARIA